MYSKCLDSLAVVLVVIHVAISITLTQVANGILVLLAVTVFVVLSGRIFILDCLGLLVITCGWHILKLWCQVLHLYY